MKIDDLKKICEIEYYGGEILSLYQHINGDYFLKKWYSCTPDGPVWLFVKTNLTLVKKYTNKEISMPALLKHKHTDYYIFEKGFRKINFNNVSNRSFGAKDAYFDEELIYQPDFTFLKKMFLKKKV